MGKTATLKDVLYGLQYGKQQLCRWPSLSNNPKPAWSLEPTGIKVPGHVADKAREVAGVVAIPSQRYGESRFAWQLDEAA